MSGCTNPLKAWKYGVHESGKQKLVFTNPENGSEVQMVPCGKCITCKLRKSLEWATRVTHELETTGLGCFITLTINEESMIRRGFHYKGEWHPPFSIYKRSLQKFFKRLRKATAIDVPDPDTGRTKKVYQKFRYLACGEYGEKLGRPHYHICLLGYDFADKFYWRQSPSGHPCYRSPLLERVWSINGNPIGHAEIGELNFQTAAYTARYTLAKKPHSEDYQHAYGYNQETGEILFSHVHPEFLLMSKGIGKDWWNRYRTDTDKDYIETIDGKTVAVPRYYDRLREAFDPESLERLKVNRELKALEQLDESRPKRRLARNTVKEAQASKLKRNLQDGNEETLRPVR